MILFAARKTYAHTASRFYTSGNAIDASRNLTHFLQRSIDCRCLKLTQQSHSQVITLGLAQDTFLTTKLISAYAICKNPLKSRLVFCSVQPKNVYMWNSLINGHVKNNKHVEAFELFILMCRGTVSPDDFTLSVLSKVSSELGDITVGKSIHGKCIRTGFVSDCVVANSVMAMYSRCGEFSQSRKVFDEMPERNSGSWNVIIGGYADTENCKPGEDVWQLVREMQIEGVKPDAFTSSSVLPLCAGDTGKCDYGRELHCFIVKNELELSFGSDVHLGCCLVDVYSRSGKLNISRWIFDRMKCRNVFAWTAMINGYAQNGASDEALFLFREMQIRDGIEPNNVSLVSILPACTSLAALMGGRQIHGFSIRRELNNQVSLCNALIDTYAKCGFLNYARRMFEDPSFFKDAISWSSMISGYGLHGKGREAISLYVKMLKIGIKPDMITIVGVLSACGRSGLVEEGLDIYTSVINDYRIKPTLEICACVVDMLGRSGQLDRALDFIKEMPLEPGPSVWGALVNAATNHGNTGMQELACKFLIQVEPENPSNYVSLSNIHASSERWNVVSEVRTLMKDKGLRKFPGCSWININSSTHCFYVADKAHPCSSSIYEMLDDLVSTMKGAGYSPDLENFT